MRILIVKMSSLGDIIHAFPVLQYLKESIPECQIDWVVEKPFSALLKAHPFIHQVIEVETKKWRSQLFNKTSWKEILQFRQELRRTEYDLILDLQSNVKSGIVTFLAKSPLKVGFAFPAVHEWPNLLATNKRFLPPAGINIREDHLFLARSALGDSQSTPCISGVRLNLNAQEKEQLESLLGQLEQIEGLKILVCPGSNWPNKQLSPATLEKFLENFSSTYKAHFLLIWGTPEEKILANELFAHFPRNSQIVERLSLPALQNLMAQVDLVLSMDSLPLHLAGTTTTPTFSFFGPSLAEKFRPIGDRHGAIQGSCPYGQTFEKRCRILRTCKTGACMKEMEGLKVFEDFLVWWKR